jgi:hypothetical protein
VHEGLLEFPSCNFVSFVVPKFPAFIIERFAVGKIKLCAVAGQIGA